MPMTKDKPETLNGIARGYLPSARPRYRWVTYDLDEDAAADDPDGEPFRARIRTNLTWGEINSIDLSGDLTFMELWEILAPWVSEWNALARDAVTSEIVPLPSPLDAGPDAFQGIEARLTMWLAVQLRTAHLGGEERGKGVSRPGSLDARPDGAG